MLKCGTLCLVVRSTNWVQCYGQPARTLRQAFQLAYWSTTSKRGCDYSWPTLSTGQAKQTNYPGPIQLLLRALASSRRPAQRHEESTRFWADLNPVSVLKGQQQHLQPHRVQVWCAGEATGHDIFYQPLFVNDPSTCYTYGARGVLISEYVNSDQ